MTGPRPTACSSAQVPVILNAQSATSRVGALHDLRVHRRGRDRLRRHAGHARVIPPGHDPSRAIAVVVLGDTQHERPGDPARRDRPAGERHDRGRRTPCSDPRRRLSVEAPRRDRRGEVARPAARVVERPARARAGRSTRPTAARGSRARRARRSTAAKSTTPAGSSTWSCVRPGAPWRSCTWSAYVEQLERIAAPVGDVTGVDEQPQRPAPRPASPRPSRREFTTAPAHGSSSAPGAARNHRTQRSHMPSARRPAPGVAHQPGPRLRERGRAADRQRERRRVDVDQTSMCAKPSSAASRGRAARVTVGARTTTSTTPSGRTRAHVLVLHRLRHHHADVLQVLAEDLVEVLGDPVARPSRRRATSTRSAWGAGRSCTRSRCGRGSGR